MTEAKRMEEDKFLLVVNTSEDAGTKSLFVVGTFDTLDEAYRRAETSASYLLNYNMKSFSVYRLSEDSLVNRLTRANLSDVFSDILGLASD